MQCPTCKEELVQVDNPFRTEYRHKRGSECTEFWGGTYFGTSIDPPKESLAGLRETMSEWSQDAPTCSVALRCIHPQRLCALGGECLYTSRPPKATTPVTGKWRKTPNSTAEQPSIEMRDGKLYTPADSHDQVEVTEEMLIAWGWVRESFADKLEDAGIQLVENPNVPESTAVMGEVDWELRADDTLVPVIEPDNRLHYSDMGTPICANEKGCPHPGFCAHALVCPLTPEVLANAPKLIPPKDDYPRLWDSEPNGVTHIAGGCIVIADRFMRQRCEWCGIVLLEYDFKLTAAQGDVWTPPAQWPTGKLVRVDGHVAALIENPQELDGMVQLPLDCCAFDPKTQVRK